MYNMNTLNWSWSNVLFNQLNIDCGTKALIIALYNDCILCIISPISAVIGNPIIQKKVSEEADCGFENNEYQESRLNILKGDLEPKN